MPDIYDQAAEIEQMQRQIALDAQAAAYAARPAVSAYECEECGEAIPEERRARLPLLHRLPTGNRTLWKNPLCCGQKL